MCLLKIQENVFQLFLKIKGLHFVNKISTKTRPKRTSFANSNTKSGGTQWTHTPHLTVTWKHFRILTLRSIKRKANNILSKGKIIWFNTHIMYICHLPNNVTAMTNSLLRPFHGSLNRWLSFVWFIVSWDLACRFFFISKIKLRTWKYRFPLEAIRPVRVSQWNDPALFGTKRFKEQQIEIDFLNWFDVIFRRNNSTERVLGCLSEV